MNELHDKAELNMLAAEKLYEENLYDSVCHPAYYSCLQLMKYKLIKKGITLEKQVSLTSSKYYGHTHQCLIHECSNFIKFSNHREEQNYKNDVKQLKIFREKADYTEERISQDSSASCIEKAKDVIKIISSIL